jgi:hypothetical protein
MIENEQLTQKRDGRFPASMYEPAVAVSTFGPYITL